MIRSISALILMVCTMVASASASALATTYANMQNPVHAFVVSSKQKWGFKDSSGYVVIKPKYQYAESFNDGRAIVKIRNKFGIINPEDDYIVQPKYELIEHAVDAIYIVQKEGKKGLMTVTNNNTSHKIAVQFVYDDISYDSKHDLYIVTKEGHKGVINCVGKEVVSCKYDDITIYATNRYRVKLGDKCGLYNSYGDVIVACEYDSIQDKSGYYFVIKGNKKGLYHHHGAKFIDVIYDDIIFAPHYILALLDNECSIYNNTKKVNTFMYDTLNTIENDYIFTLNGKYGLVAEDNFDSCITLYDSIESHPADVYVVTCDNKYGIVSSQGKELVEPILNQLDKERLSYGWQLCESGSEYYMVSKNKMLTLHQYERANNNPWDKGYTSLSSGKHAVVYDELIGTCKFEYSYSSSGYEENVGDNTYTHTRIYRTLTVGDYSLNYIQHQINKQYYLYIEKDNTIKRKVAGSELAEFIDKITEYKLKMISAQLLSNGDILLEAECNATIDRSNIKQCPTIYANINGQMMSVSKDSFYDAVTSTMRYIVVLDGKNYKIKGKVLLPEQLRIIGVSNYGGWYVGQSTYSSCVASNTHPISRFSNKCGLVWSYAPKEGDGITAVCETPESFYLGGYTTNRGYIGKYNPYICRLDRVNGKKKDEKFFKLANQDYSVTKFDNGYAQIAPIRDRYYFNYYSNDVESYDFSDIDPIRLELIRCVHNDIYAYGIVNQYREWIVEPVLPGEMPKLHGDWIVYPCNVYKGDKLIVSGAPVVKYKDKDIENTEEWSTPNVVIPSDWQLVTIKREAKPQSGSATMANDKILNTDIDFYDNDGFDIVFEEIEEVEEDIEEEFFVTVEEMPTFQGGGLPEFRNWVQSNVKYPQIALENGIQGNVVVQFVVDTDGKMIRFKILQSPDKTLSDATIEVLKKANELKKGWKPGKQRGKAVKVSFTLPVKFAIQGYGD